MEPFYEVRQDGPHTIVTFTTESLAGSLELERIGQSLFRLVDEEKRHLLVLDFTPVKYLSSQAIGIILSLDKRLKAHKGSRFVLCGVGPQLLQLLKITRLDRILTIKTNQQEAVAAK